MFKLKKALTKLSPDEQESHTAIVQAIFALIKMIISFFSNRKKNNDNTTTTNV